jgi:CBS domain-containing protein
MLAREAMTRTPVTVTEDTTVRQAARTLYTHDIAAAPVVGESGSMVGIVSELDLFRSEFEHDPRAFLGPVTAEDSPPPLRVSEVMTRKVISVTESTDVATVAELMAKSGVKSVPVLHGEELVGIVSRRDLLKVLAESDAQVLDDVVAAVEDLFPGAPAPDIEVHEGTVTLTGQADVLTSNVIETLARTVPGVARVTVVDRAG